MIEKIYSALSKEDQEDVLKYAVSKMLPTYSLVKKEELAMYAAAYDVAYGAAKAAEFAAGDEPEPEPVVKTSKPKRGKPVTVLGYKYETMAAAARDNNMSIQRVHYRATSKGQSKVAALEDLILKEKNLHPGFYPKEKIRPVEMTIGGESLSDGN